MISELNRLSKPTEAHQPKTDTEFFSAIAKCLNYLKNPKPTLGNYAVEALQNAFLVQMKIKYEWGKKGYPTKGEVRNLAKALLEESGRNVPKSGWTKFRQNAGLDWLEPGKGGRPQRWEVGEIRKVEQEIDSIITKQIETHYGGDPSRFLDALKASHGGKKLSLQNEAERLTEEYGRPRFPEEDEASA
jgi:hypothetical protein